MPELPNKTIDSKLEYFLQEIPETFKRPENCFDILNAQPEASFKTLKDQYKRLALHYHPEAGINWKTDRFIKIYLAWNCLKFSYHSQNKDQQVQKWQSNQFQSDLERALAYASIPLKDFERTLHPGLFILRSIVYAFFLMVAVGVLMIRLHEFLLGNTGLEGIICIPIVFAPIVAFIIKSRQTEKKVKREIHKIKQL
jgi:hypothetical protein